MKKSMKKVVGVWVLICGSFIMSSCGSDGGNSGTKTTVWSTSTPSGQYGYGNCGSDVISDYNNVVTTCNGLKTVDRKQNCDRAVTAFLGKYPNIHCQAMDKGTSTESTITPSIVQSMTFSMSEAVEDTSSIALFSKMIENTRDSVHFVLTLLEWHTQNIKINSLKMDPVRCALLSLEYNKFLTATFISLSSLFDFCVKGEIILSSSDFESMKKMLTLTAKNQQILVKRAEMILNNSDDIAESRSIAAHTETLEAVLKEMKDVENELNTFLGNSKGIWIKNKSIVEQFSMDVIIKQQNFLEMCPYRKKEVTEELSSQDLETKTEMIFFIGMILKNELRLIMDELNVFRMALERKEIAADSFDVALIDDILTRSLHIIEIFGTSKDVTELEKTFESFNQVVDDMKKITKGK